MSGVELIAEERLRQVEVEGWTPEHDDLHGMGELARAARCYAIPRVKPSSPRPNEWPWQTKWWKPSEDPIRNLVKAGALIAAEIERLQRLKESANTFVCAKCGEEFPDNTPEAEVLAESRKLFGEHASGNLAAVCDECFEQVKSSL